MIAVRSRPLLAAALLLTLAACSSPKAAPLPSTTPSPTATEEASAFAGTPVTAGAEPDGQEPPPDLDPMEEGDWSTANGGPRNTRARGGGIDSSNVARLDPIWTMPITGRGPYGGAAGAPAIADGVVYFQDLESDVFALDLESGERLWAFREGLPVAGPNGPAVADGRVFVATGGDRFAALDATTGDVLWSITLEKDAFQPTVLGDTVFAGTGNRAHAGGSSGMLHALDAATGETRWSFQVVEDGFWGDPALNSGGGVWYPAAIDLERGLAYIGTGNAGPYPGTRDFPNGSSRPGANLYTSSLIAIDLETGELHWYHQAVRHGLFDHDLQLPPVITSIGSGDAAREIVIAGGKLGRVLAFDLDTHELLWDTAVGKHENDDLGEIPVGQLVEVYPGTFGGVTTPLAVAGGLVFVPVVNAATTQSATGHGATDGTSALINASSRTALAAGNGELIALDAASGTVRWRREFDSPVFGGATAVGDLVFTATFDGMIYALRQRDGAELWSFQAPGGINAWPAVDGSTIVWASGLGAAPQLIAFSVVEE